MVATLSVQRRHLSELAALSHGLLLAPNARYSSRSTASGMLLSLQYENGHEW